VNDFGFWLWRRYLTAKASNSWRQPAPRVKDGKPIDDDDKATAFLAENMKPILEDFVSIWKRLGVLAN
jgi:hypothetical protein